VQIWQKAVEGVPGLTQHVERGEFGPLRDWLREHVHRHGRKFTPKEMLKRITGSDEIDVNPFISYLRAKFGEIYELA
jgi:carboxypeptidase Taq